MPNLSITAALLATLRLKARVLAARTGGYVDHRVAHLSNPPTRPEPPQKQAEEHRMIHLVLITLLAACGTAPRDGDGDESETQATTSPASPSSSQRVPFERAPSGGAPSAAVGTEPEPELDGVPSDPMCLMGCAIPFEAQYSFALPTALTPPECAVSDLAVHDAWDGLVAVFRADCGFGQQAYLRPLTYAGEPKAAPILVSKACADGIKQVGALSSAVGPKGVVVISACVMTSTSAALTSTLVKPDSSLTAAEPIETLTYYNNAADALAAQMPVLVWNPSATTFGLARRGAFRRLSDTGKLLAGVVKMSESTTSSTPIRSSAVINGNWHFLRGGAYSGDSALCSTVSPLGVSLCNDKSSDPLRPIFLGGDRLLSVRYRNELRFAPFSPDTCSTAEAATIGYVRESDINELYNAVSLSSAYHAVLYSGETGLQLAIFTLRPVALVSVIAVSSAGADAQLHLQKDRLAVTFHRDGRAYLLVSEQTLHSGQ